MNELGQGGVGLRAMPPWKHWLLHAYYPVTWPLRRLALARLERSGRAPVMVFVFHRVANDWANAWTMRTDAFEAAIRWLKERFELISLSEAQRRVRGGRLHRSCAAITFDDGYASNMDVALPLLVRERIPCTYFVTTNHILSGAPFEHDLKLGQRHAPNTLDDLRRLVATGIEMGGHSRTHANLAALDSDDALRDEMVASRDELQSLLGTTLKWFAFPFGQHRNLSPRAFQVAREAGYEGVVSAYGGYNLPGDDPFHLQRIGADGPLLRLKLWATYDPKKHYGTARFPWKENAASEYSSQVVPT